MARISNNKWIELMTEAFYGVVEGGGCKQDALAAVAKVGAPTRVEAAWLSVVQ